MLESSTLSSYYVGFKINVKILNTLLKIQNTLNMARDKLDFISGMYC